jgi:hypothetical protein
MKNAPGRILWLGLLIVSVFLWMVAIYIAFRD